MDSEEIFKKLSIGAIFTKRQTSSFKYQTKTEKREKNEWTDPSNNNENLNNAIEEVKNDKKKQKKQKNPEKLKLIENEEINFKRNKNKISVSGQNVPPPIENFQELSELYNFSSQLIQNIRNCGYESPTPIQMQAVPIMLKKRHILACAPTGSGKTAAFLIPIIHKLNKPKNTGIRAVIVSPTRELSRQTYRECVRLSEGTNLRIHITTKLKETIKKSCGDSSNKCDILITTPNRLLFLLNQEPSGISLKSVEWLIVDESDKLFETGVRGFRDQLAVIYRACDSNNVVRAMFSATKVDEVSKWCYKRFQNLISVTVGQRNTTVKSVEQQLVYVGNEEGKLIAMRDLIREGISPPVLIFLQSKERAKELFQELLYDGINVDVIHADRTQLQRDNVVRAFREGKIWVLICTELMGRGIDFKGVNLVINYDFPLSAISYIHRIGRTGRAGRSGKAITFFADADTPFLKSVINVMKESGCEIPSFMLSMKKPHKKTLKKLKSKLPSQGNIAEKPHRYKSSLQNSKLKAKADMNVEDAKADVNVEDAKSNLKKKSESNAKKRKIETKNKDFKICKRKKK